MPLLFFPQHVCCKKSFRKLNNILSIINCSPHVNKEKLFWVKSGCRSYVQTSLRRRCVILFFFLKLYGVVLRLYWLVQVCTRLYLPVQPLCWPIYWAGTDVVLTYTEVVHASTRLVQPGTDQYILNISQCSFFTTNTISISIFRALKKK